MIFLSIVNTFQMAGISVVTDSIRLDVIHFHFQWVTDPAMETNV